MKFDQIIVATDLSEAAREGYPHAASWGRQFGAKVVVLYCESDPELLAAMPVDNAERVRSKAAAKRDERLAQAKSDITAYGAECECAIVGGDPKEAIAEYIEQRGGSSMLVMTKHTSLLERITKLGSTTARLLRTSKVPVLVVHTGDSPGSPTHVMIAHDVTEGSADGLQAALDLSAAWEAEVTAVHAVDRQGAVSLFGADLPADLPSAEELVGYYQKILVEQMAQKGAQHHKAKAKVAGEMPVGEALAGAAQQIRADLICIPSVSRNSLEVVLLGSTTERLVTHTHVPVFVMPQEWLAPDDVDRVIPVEPPQAS